MTWYPTSTYFEPLLAGIAEVAHSSFQEGKQAAIDLLAVEVASKNAIIDASDYVALGYKVTDAGVIVAPAEDPTA